MIKKFNVFIAFLLLIAVISGAFSSCALTNNSSGASQSDNSYLHAYTVEEGNTAGKIHIASTGREIYGVGYKPITVNEEAGTVTFTVDSFSPFLLAGTPIEYYGRSALAGLADSAALLYAYDQIVKGVENSKESITVYNGTDAITRTEIKTVFDAYRRDHTEHFWLGSSYSISYNSTTVLSVMPSYDMSGEALETAKTAFDSAVAEMLDGVTSSMSEYERELLLHDRLAAKVSYDMTAANPHNAYGAIVEGKAVCEGYAEAYQYLLQEAGIQSFLAIGSSNNPVSGTPEGHAWNIVRIDGKYYHVDTTWDDQGERIFYAYFNKTDAAIGEDHSMETTAYALPECNSETADYFFVNGGRLPAFDLDAVTTLLRNGGGMARIYVTGDKTAFAEALAGRISDLASALGYSGGYRYSYANLGREFILTVAPAGVTLSGRITGFGSAADSVTVELYKAGEATASYRTELSGGIKDSTGRIEAEYSIAGVTAGTYIMKVSKADHVTREYTITAGTTAVAQDVQIYRKGDVNMDGEVDIGDHQRLFEHIQGVSLITDDYQLCISDTNGDGETDIGDHQRLFEHIQGINPLFVAE